MPKQLARLRINRLEPPFHRAVEHDVARGRNGTAPDREIFFDLPCGPLVHGVPRCNKTAVAAWARVEFIVAANIRRPRDVVRLDALYVHANILMWDIEEPGLR